MVGEEPQLVEGWDWRQTYAQYADMPELQHLLQPAPEAPEPVAAPLPVGHGGRGFTVAAFVVGGLALVLFPFVLGPLGAIFGFVANSRGDRIGRWAAFLSIATTVLGIALSILVTHSLGVRLWG